MFYNQNQLSESEFTEFENFQNNGNNIASEFNNYLVSFWKF